MLKPREKVSDREGDLREDAVVTAYARALQFYEQFKRPLMYGGLAAVVLVLGYVGYRFYMSGQNAEAEEELGQIVRVYEQGNFQQALEGTSGQAGLLQIVDEYGGTRAGNLARYYAGDAFYNLGDHERAIEQFEAFEKGENYLGAAGYAGLAASHASQGNVQRAAEYYEEAARVYENEATTPMYLEQAAQYYEDAGQLEEARSLYQEIQEDYPESQQAQNVAIDIQRLEMRISRRAAQGSSG